MLKEKDGWSIPMIFLCNDFNGASLVEYLSFVMHNSLSFFLHLDSLNKKTKQRQQRTPYGRVENELEVCSMHYLEIEAINHMHAMPWVL
jgi:hypothetical protein